MARSALYTLPEGSLPQSALQEQLSVAFVHMVASAAGCSLERHDSDYDGVDLTVASKVKYSHYKSPKVDLQLKCTTQDVVGPETVNWSVDRRTWEYIADRSRYVPAILGVLVVPKDIPTWLEHDETMLLTRSAMYWSWGKDLGDIPETQASGTAKIPRKNQFSATSLLGIMHVIGTAARS